MTPQLTSVFRRSFAEQVAAFRLRLGNLVPTAKWDDLRGAEHDRAFMVAGAVKADLLADLGNAVDKAIADGQTLDWFRKEFRGIVEKHGWHGWTGEGTKGGEAWRTRVIYRTNMATTYAAGRMAQLVEGGFLLWVYRHGASREPREQHLAWDGLVLPPDHPFWQTHAPPNGWGCSCYVLGARSEAGARRLGGRPELRLPDDWDRLDPKTGAPPGIDKGWGHAPGLSVARTVRALVPKLNSLPRPLSTDLIRSWIEEEPFARWYENPVDLFPIATLPDADALALSAQTRVVMLSPETLEKQKREHPELERAEYALVQTTLDQAQRRLTDHNPETGTASRVFVLVRPSERSGGYVLVVKATQTRMGLFFSSFRRLSRDDARRDEEVRRLLRRRQRTPPTEAD